MDYKKMIIEMLNYIIENGTGNELSIIYDFIFYPYKKIKKEKGED